MRALLAGVMVVPAVIIAIAVTYQVGDYFDPDPPQRDHLVTRVEQLRYDRQPLAREGSGRPPIEQKIGRGLKQGAMGVGVLVLIPIAAIIGLVLSFAMADKRVTRRSDDLY
ncbi:MAG TPA: hypothetical protein VHB79_24160 [Polyangiaceae bacterium]|nr:hypothetical protein [Polyangiaceae bacterium]